jgi:hypothetical protein
MGIVHRDLKPDNIMIAKGRGGADLVKVVDFGIAKAAANEAQKVTKTGMVVGTPEYMSPEQLSGDPLDARSDIYALALVAFNMFTGKLPFPGETMQESMIMRLTDEPKQLLDMKPDVAWPADLQAVLNKALARSADNRYKNASEFAHDLVQAIDRMPVTSITAMGTEVLKRMSANSMNKAQTAATVQVEVPQTRQVSTHDEGATRPSKSRPSASPAHTPTKSKTGMYAGIGGGALLAAAVAAYIVMKNPEAGKTPPNSADSPAPAQTSVPTDSVKPAGVTTPPATVQLNNNPLPVNVSDSLRTFARFLELKTDSTSAARLVDRLIALDVKTPADKAEAALILYTARLRQLDADGACQALKEAVGDAPAAQKAKIEQRLTACP